MTLKQKSVTKGYQSPCLVEVGTLHQLTLGCNKDHGSSDGFTFQGQSIVCTSP